MSVRIKNYKRLKHLASCLSMPRPGLEPGSVHVGFVMGRVTMGQVSLRVFGFSVSVSFHLGSILIDDLGNGQ
jgi:hypothetical protein